MASKARTLTFRDILTQIKKGDLAPVYLLQGDEPYYIDRLCDAFENGVVPEEERDFNQTLLYGAETDVAAIAAAAQQYPFMADRRLVMAKELQAMPRAKNEIELLAPYAARPNSQSVLVLVYKGESLRATSALIKSIGEGNGVIFTSSRLKEYQLKSPVRDYVESRRFHIDDQATEMLIALTGSNLSKLFGEIDKMIIACGDKMNRITPQLVQAMTGMSKEFAPYELANALAARDMFKCMAIVNQAARNPAKNPVVVMIPTLFRMFLNIAIAHQSDNKSEAGIMQAIGAKNVYAVREIKAAMNNFSLTSAVNAISAIREFDCNSKGIRSQQKEHELLKELIYKILAS